MIWKTTDNWSSYLLADNWVICRFRDRRIYLVHAIDQSQGIKQLQCMIIFLNSHFLCSLPEQLYTVPTLCLFSSRQAEWTPEQESCCILRLPIKFERSNLSWSWFFWSLLHVPRDVLLKHGILHRNMCVHVDMYELYTYRLQDLFMLVIK